MKKITAVLIIALLCVSLCSCNSSLVTTIKGYLGQETVEKPAGYIETKENEFYVYDVFKKHIELLEYKGTEKDVVVPTELDGKPVTVIGDSCFYRNESVETVIVPEGIEVIETAAFYCCTSLRRASLPESCSSYGEKLFSWCTSLESIKLPSGMTSVPDYAFNNCTSLSEIIWNTTVTHIGVRAFSWCTSLNTVVLPENVQTVADYAFFNCGTLQSVIIPPETEYAPNAFEECDNATITGGTVMSETSDVSEDSPEPEEISQEVSQTIS
ncbi:MAG: leucine-rich repeat domain-containing protein [Clostridia bacterium]|nr:leucine-rich repeat domain-containing protein [Clostridia bacterium]MBO7245937.1 leucine-rich repeat domain-containing protein [Clostridia bacterium]